MRIPTVLAAVAAVLALAVAGCGGSSSKSSAGKTSTGASNAANPNAPEVSPQGDIPDNQAYVPYSPPKQGYSVKVPEGWSRTDTHGAVVFTDKLNSIRMESVKASAPLTARDARQTELPKLAKSVKGFQPQGVSVVTRAAGPAVRMTYLATGPANQVTGKAGTVAVERYVYYKGGRDVVLTLTGPKGADNVDPWRIVTDSLRWTR
jgi:hypothetical protein